MADVEKAEPEYVPADYVAPADAEQTSRPSWARRHSPAFRAPRASLLWSALTLVHIPLPTKDNILRILNQAFEPM